MLRRRLLFNLLPFTLILLATGGYAIVLFSRLGQTFERAVGEHYRSLVAVQQMSVALAGLDREAWTVTSDGKPGSREAAACQRQFEDALASLRKNSPQEADYELGQALVGKYQQLRRLNERLGAAAGAERRRVIYEEQITPCLLELRALLDRILQANQKAILATNLRVQDLTRQVTHLMLLGTLIALVLAAYASYQLGRWVLRPIQRVTIAARELAEGNSTPPMPVHSEDELGELVRTFNRMAGRLEEYRQSTTEQIMRLHRTMESTLASFPDPIFVLSQQGAVELKNPAARDLAAALGIAERLPPSLQTRAQEMLARGENFLPHSFSEVISYRVQSTEKYFLPRILTMRTREDAPFGVAVVLYDVTRFRLLDAAKTHLVGTVSHELKTPLTSVRMVLHLLLEKSIGALTPKQQELVEAAKSDTERLLRILNDLLDLARLEEGGAELHRESVAPAELLAAAAQEASEKANAKRLRFWSDVDPNLPAVLVDRQRIGYAFANLVSNAIKHSPEGGEIRLRAARGADHSLVFSVADDGPGIPQAYQARIFERFFRVPGQAKSGAGLGLSIAREIAVAHGGWLSVESAPGQGTTFYLVLKLPGDVQ
jgi:two-component system, NtrC family, sensor histidine kinase KinB